MLGLSRQTSALPVRSDLPLSAHRRTLQEEHMQTRLSLPAKPRWLGEFRAFVARGNVVDLAIGIIIGAAFTGVVHSLVKGVITPLIGAAVGGVDFSKVFVALNGQRYPTLDAAQKAGAPTVNIG